MHMEIVNSTLTLTTTESDIRKLSSDARLSNQTILQNLDLIDFIG